MWDVEMNIAGFRIRRRVQRRRHLLRVDPMALVSPDLRVRPSGADEQRLTSLAAEIFTLWREASKRAYLREGFEPAQARALADTAIAAMEGAVLLCRSTRSLEPLNDVAQQLEFLITARKFVAKDGIAAVSA